MRWDRFFEDIEDQLESEWEAERAALETEAERLRLSRMALRERLLALAAPAGGEPARAAIELADGSTVTAPVAGVGADWVLASPWGSRSGAALIPLTAVTAVGMTHAELLRTARGATGPTPLSGRATFGFAVRDLARRRVGVSIHTIGGREISGTIDRAGADHMDVAQHDRDEPRRAAAVHAYRIVAFAAVAWIGVAGGALPTIPG